MYGKGRYIFNRSLPKKHNKNKYLRLKYFNNIMLLEYMLLYNPLIKISNLVSKIQYDLSTEFVDKDGKILVKASFIRTFPE